MKSASLRPRTLAWTLMRARLASGEAHDAGQRQGNPPSGGDDRIIATRAGRRGASTRVLAAILIGISLAAVFGSEPALRWTETLSDGRLATALRDAAAWCNETLSPLGVSRPHEWLRATIRAFEAMHF